MYLARKRQLVGWLLYTLYDSLIPYFLFMHKNNDKEHKGPLLSQANVYCFSYYYWTSVCISMFVQSKELRSEVISILCTIHKHRTLVFKSWDGHFRVTRHRLLVSSCCIYKDQDPSSFAIFIRVYYFMKWRKHIIYSPSVFEFIYFY